MFRPGSFLSRAGMNSSYSRSYVEISKSAFFSNITQIAGLLPSSAILAPVIKANAYGHGIFEIASWCQNLDRIDMLCVALLSDALKLQASGISKPILVIGAIDTDPAQALGKNIHLFVYSRTIAQELHAIALDRGLPFLVHIKIDTGLSRLGLLYTNAIQEISDIRKLSGLEIVGIYSHFSQAQACNIEFSNLQIQRFTAIISELHAIDMYPRYIHMSNSAATLRFTIPGCNLFRVGAAIYGLWPSEETRIEVQKKHPSFDLKPVLRWKSHIMHIQTIPAGSFIGYNGTHQVTRPSRIAIIPVGYQDGYDIQFSNTTYILINNTIVQIVGRICMNHCMADITDLTDIQIGAQVTLIGTTAPVDTYTLAKASGNNNVRELLTHINPDFIRTYTE